MSNVIAFVQRVPEPRRSSSAMPVLPWDGTFCATLLLEGVDDPLRALDKAERLAGTLPHGRVRDMAEHELARVRLHLGLA